MCGTAGAFRKGVYCVVYTPTDSGRDVPDTQNVALFLFFPFGGYIVMFAHPPTAGAMFLTPNTLQRSFPMFDSAGVLCFLHTYRQQVQCS